MLTMYTGFVPLTHIGGRLPMIYSVIKRSHKIIPDQSGVVIWVQIAFLRRASNDIFRLKLDVEGKIKAESWDVSYQAGSSKACYGWY